MILSVVDDVGIRTVIDTMLQNTKTENADQRRAAATLLCAFCANSKAQYAAHVPQLLRGLIYLMTDSDRDVLQRAWEALNAVTKVNFDSNQSYRIKKIICNFSCRLWNRNNKLLMCQTFVKLCAMRCPI